MSCTSRQVLATAKVLAIEQFCASTVLDAFRELLHRRYHVPRELVVIDEEGARRRLCDAVLLGLRESEERQQEIWGETDGVTISVLRGTSLSQCTWTLLHEAMHDCVFIERTTRSGTRKSLSCDVEHEVIYALLGEAECLEPMDVVFFSGRVYQQTSPS